MNAAERRGRILEYLRSSDGPLAAAALAQKLSVSRQIIVGDVALLRAAGLEIVATPRGYKLGEHSGLLRTVACVHDGAGLEAELLAMVDNGCTVIDVVVEHPLYGEITGQLQLSSRYDVQQFLEKAQCAAPLSSLTKGVHIHNLRCPSEEAFQRVRERLTALEILYDP